MRPRAHSLLSLVENPLVVLDEPEQIAAAAERLWKRLEDRGPAVLLARRIRIFSLGRVSRAAERQRRAGRCANWS